MMRSTMAAALLTCCFLAGCNSEPQRVVTHLPTPPERLVCEGVPAQRPTIPPERTVPGGLETASVRAREAVVAGYVVLLESRLFTCANNMQWRREYEAGLTGQGG